MNHQIANPAHADREEWAEANESGGADLDTTPEALIAEALNGDARDTTDKVAWQVVNCLSEEQARQALANFIKGNVPEEVEA